MNFDKALPWILAIVVSAAAAGRLNELQAWIWRAEARVIFENRASSWGSPRFFSN